MMQRIMNELAIQFIYMPLLCNFWTLPFQLLFQNMLWHRKCSGVKKKKCLTSNYIMAILRELQISDKTDLGFTDICQ